MSFIISENGATLISWKNELTNGEVFFTSSKAIFEPGKAIRGGVPICFPWFGPMEGMPQHGFVRNNLWESLSQDTMRFKSNEKTKTIWPYDFQAHLSVKEDQNKLTISFHVENTGKEAFEFSFALHSYFFVNDIKNIKINGLSNIPYYDKTDDGNLKIQEDEDILIDGEIDRVYLSNASVEILDIDLQRAIIVNQEGGNATIVWNPGQIKSKSIGDLGEGEYIKFVCVESGITPSTKKLIPGDTHEIVQSVEVIKLVSRI